MKEFKFKIGSQSYSTTVNEQEDGTLEVVVNGKTYHVEMPQSEASVRPRVSAPSYSAAAPAAAPRTGAAQTKGTVCSELPGTVTKVVAAEGAKVKKGDVLVVIEAMKMQNDILAEADGTVGKIHVSAGQSVGQGDALVDLLTEAAPVAAAAPKAAPAAAPVAPKPAAPVAAGASAVTSPLPGTVSKILVKEGDAVKAGQTVVVVEAMKMQNDIVAEVAGTVKSVRVSEGSQVQGGDVLIELA